MKKNRQNFSLNYQEIEFTKIHGAGNDFILINNINNKYSIELSELAREICQRRIGIGADGLLIIEKSDKADFKMRYLNSDGTEVGMCGNGGRCVAFYAFSNFLKNKEIVSFEALNFIYNAEKVRNNIRLIMNDPTDIKSKLSLKYQKEKIIFDFIDTGAPHVCLFIDENDFLKNDKFENIKINTIGKFIRYHKFFSPVGTNVNFIQKVKKGEIRIRTYERGVEEETLACGTGSVASGILSALRYKWKPPIVVNTLNNFKLLVNFKLVRENIINVSLEGPSQIVFSGIFRYSKKIKNII